MTPTKQKKIEKELDCILGLCNHTIQSKTCQYWKIVDSPHPEKAQKKAIVNLITTILGTKKKNNIVK